MSGTYRRSSRADDEKPQPTLLRLDQAVYAGLKSYSAVSNASMNAIANEALATYLAKPEVQQVLSAAPKPPDSEKLEAVVRRLSGEDA